MAQRLWKLTSHRVVRLPFLCPAGDHVIAAIGIDRRIAAYARVFSHAEERELGRLIDPWVDDPRCPVPAPFQVPQPDAYSRPRWVPLDMT